MPINLFGKEQPYPEKHKVASESYYQRFKRINHYRLADHSDVSCKTCTNRRSWFYHDKHYHKCALIGESHSEATDIRLKHCCDKWEFEEDGHEIFYDPN